ncbi:hypothetical protein [Sulfitobacter sp. PS-8MA]|uniref:hypothetical protein n=1 Tax=Sulfitobacter sp. PS-8MA TaxID=3237707 RepID=UPI0034C63557
MIGVVLWSDNDAGKAVFWCEDQGDLAYYETTTLKGQNVCLFDTGDMVQFDISVHRRLRIADNPRLLQEKAGAALPDALRQQAGRHRRGMATAPRDAAPSSAEIIQFTPRRVAARPASSALKA